MKIDRIKEILNQVKEGLETIDSATTLLHNDMKTCYTKGFDKATEENNKENIETDELIYLLMAADDMTWFTSKQVDLIENIVRNHKSNLKLIANNLHDEQKLDLFQEAMQKYTLEELEIKLA